MRSFIVIRKEAFEMLPKQLRNGILHLAITGKLVEQDPNDEPASVLLEKIRAEKQELIKSGKIKKDKNESFIYRNPDGVPYEKIGDKEQCIAEQIPFEIPSSWEWVRLGNVCSIFGRIGYRGYTKNDMVNKGEGAISISPTNIKSNASTIFDNCTYISWDKYYESPEIMIDNEDIIIVKTGSSYGKSAIVSNLKEKATINPQLVVLKYIHINRYWFIKYLMSYIVKKQCQNFVVGTCIPTISQEKLASILIPLPPLEEQKRIVEKLEKLLPLVDEYEENYNELEKLDSEFPDKFKKSILQYAIQGKLVKQDPNDEPASVLLEKIRAEKQELIKSGKIKKDKNEAVIYRKTSATQHDVSYKNINNGCFASNEKDQNEGIVDFYEKFANGEEKCINDELPFEIPSSWEWVRLGNVCKSITAGGDKPLNYSKNKTSELNIPIYSNGEKNNGLFGYTDIARITEPSITVSARGTIGFSVVRDEPYTPIVRLIVLIPFKSVLLRYLQRVFSLLLKKYDGVGTSIQQLTVPMIYPKLFPLPPLEEQKRIVAKIEELFKIIEPLEEK